MDAAGSSGYIADMRSGNATDWYTGHVRYTSRTGQRPSLLRVCVFSWFFLVSSNKMMDSTTIWPLPLPSKPFPIHH
jgi:hypothetical protein